MYTRKQYLDGECTHEDYYNQFCDSWTETVILSRYNIRFLREKFSDDENLNNIPLALWDNMAYGLMMSLELNKKMRKHGDYPTVSGCVCILKQSVRNIVLDLYPDGT